MNRKIISELLNGIWHIDEQYADSHLPLVIALLQGQNPVSFVERTGNDAIEMPFAVNPSTMDRAELYIRDAYTGKMVPNPNIANNSVGVLPITGPCTYYNGDCGEPGMILRTNWLMEMGRRDSISAIVQLIDTPGGVSTAAPNYVAQMKKSGKPILSYVDQCCASLGMYFASTSKETYLGHAFAAMGSVGSYCTLIDPSGWLDKQGYKLIKVYAPQSTDKNKVYNDALAGDTTAMKADLALYVDSFIKHVKTQLPGAAAYESDWNSGKMFYAQDAVNIGFANGIRPFDQVVSKAAWLAKRNKN